MARTAAAHSLPSWDRKFMGSFVLVGLVILLGGRLPLPGLAPQFVTMTGEASPDPALWSVFALGFDPVLSALLLFEIAKLLVPRFARWTAEPVGGFLRPRTALAAVALLAAAIEANRLMQGFAAADAIGRDEMSAPLMMASLIAGVATLLFLAERTSVPELALGGVWLMLSVPWMETVVFAVIDLNRQIGFGQIEASDLGVLASLLAAAVAAVVFSSATLRERVAASGRAPMRWSALLVWPPVLAGPLAQGAAGLADAVLTADANPVLQHPCILQAAFSGVILPVVLFLYAESIERLSPRATAWRGRRAVLALIAVVQVLICVGFQMLPVLFPASYPIEGASLIVVAAVFSAAYRPGRLPPDDEACGPDGGLGPPINANQATSDAPLPRKTLPPSRRSSHVSRSHN